MSQDENQSSSGREQLDAVLREYGGLEGLARAIGQGDPVAYRYEPCANDNTRRNAAGPLRRLWTRLLGLMAVAT